jgi:2-aminomuconate deaminase
VSDPIITGRAASPVGPYPHARVAGGLLFLSGIGPRKAATNEIPVGFDAQCEGTFANVRAIVADAGASWADVVDVTVFLTHMERDFEALNRHWAEQFAEPATRPTRTTVEVARLPTAIDIELKVIVSPGSGR